MLTPPAPLGDAHELRGFSSGVASLDEWLARRARANQASGATRCFVVTDGARVVAYYALASGSVSVAAAGGRFRRNMPDPVPVVILGRLAVDTAWQGRGLGRALFGDCAARVVQAADSIGIRGIVVHALSPGARAFYVALGFAASPMDEMILMVTLADVVAVLRG